MKSGLRYSLGFINALGSAVVRWCAPTGVESQSVQLAFTATVALDSEYPPLLRWEGGCSFLVVAVVRLREHFHGIGIALVEIVCRKLRHPRHSVSLSQTCFVTGAKALGLDVMFSLSKCFADILIIVFCLKSFIHCPPSVSRWVRHC